MILEFISSLPKNLHIWSLAPIYGLTLVKVRLSWLCKLLALNN